MRETPSACAGCLRRSWIVHCLGPRLDVRRYHTEQLAEVFALGEQELLGALGVGGVAELEARYGPPPTASSPPQGSEPAIVAICRHDPGYPPGPAEAAERTQQRWAPPPVLRVAGEIDRLGGLAASPAVAIVGTRRATDYGLTVAYRLARELGGCGLPVLGAFADGIACAAHAGALAAGGSTVTVMAAGVERAHPAGQHSLYRDIIAHGCAISELPLGARARRWSYAAGGRIVAGLATTVVVVEAEERPGDLMLARFARSLGRTVVAVPGRVTSAASRGVHALVREGTPIVRDAQDVLDAVYGAGSGRLVGDVRARSPSALSRDARRVLELVLAGADTADDVVQNGVAHTAALSALTELELAAELVRGHGGRYVPSLSCASGARSGL
jgi:DNA processing protein